MNVIQERRCSNNRLGFEVRHLTPNGWKPCSVIFKTEVEARLHMQILNRDGTAFMVDVAMELKKKC